MAGSPRTPIENNENQASETVLIAISYQSNPSKLRNGFDCFFQEEVKLKRR